LKILLLNQTFHPDVMATAQYLTQLACALAERGHEVTVVTSRRAYDEPGKQFAARETWRGIKIHRVASAAFGKTAKWRRAADFASFLLSCCGRLMSLPKQDVVVALTSPPLISFFGACLARLRGSRFVYWVMDFNPDEAIAAGWLRSGSCAARILERMSRFSLRRAHRIIALDRFMRDRIVAKGIPAEKIVVLPPWAQDDLVHYDAAGRERFRAEHGLQDKFVVTYSGNHSPIHPLNTLLEAAERLAGERDIAFCFIGGGSEFRRVQRLTRETRETSNIQQPTSNVQPSPPRTVPSPAGAGEGGRRPGEGHGEKSPSCGRGQGEVSSICPQPSTLNPQPLPNLLCLPYQPLDQLSASLSAADMHVVVMGTSFVGITHPCKIYNILSIGTPVLYIGPRPSHVTEISDAAQGGLKFYPALHGDVDGLAAQIRKARDESLSSAQHSSSPLQTRYSKETLLPRLIAELESA